MKTFCIDSEKLPSRATVILGVPSIGNCGQLATDVILSTLSNSGNIVRMGGIESDYLIPVSGREQVA